MNNINHTKKNGSTYTMRQRKIRDAYKKSNGDPRENFLGREDYLFLKSSLNTRDTLPERQTSSNILDLRRAIAEESISDIKEKLNAGIPVNSSNYSGESLLHLAVLQQNVEIVKLLLDAGANPDKKINNYAGSPYANDYFISSYGTAGEATPLHYACGTGNIEIVQLLLQAKGCKNLDIGNLELSGTPLLWAVSSGFVDIVLLLLKSGAEYKCLDLNLNNSAMIALRFLRRPEEEEALREILSMFIGRGIDVNSKNSNDHTLYDIAGEDDRLKRIISEDFKGKSGKLSSLEKLFSWDVERSRKEWPFQLNNGHFKRCFIYEESIPEEIKKPDR